MGQWNWPRPSAERYQVMANLVVDTNVFVHSSNPNNAYFSRSIELIDRIKSSDCVLCLDEGFDSEEASNRSRIWGEYLQFIPEASLARELLSHLLITNRVEDFSVKVTQNLHNEIKKKVSDPADIVFVKVSYNSQSVHLTSHDFAAFPQEVRDDFRQKSISDIVDCLGVTGI